MNEYAANIDNGFRYNPKLLLMHDNEDLYFSNYLFYIMNAISGMQKTQLKNMNLQ